MLIIVVVLTVGGLVDGVGDGGRGGGGGVVAGVAGVHNVGVVLVYLATRGRDRN